jgi:hypothetical protein
MSNTEAVDAMRKAATCGYIDRISLRAFCFAAVLFYGRGGLVAK